MPAALGHDQLRDRPRERRGAGRDAQGEPAAHRPPRPRAAVDELVQAAARFRRAPPGRCPRAPPPAPVHESGEIGTGPPTLLDATERCENVFDERTYPDAVISRGAYRHMTPPSCC